MTEVAYSSKVFEDIALKNTILRGQVGSGLHGVTIDGYDDRDEMGICIEPPEYVIGNSKFEQYQFRTQPEGVRSGYGDLDLVIYSLRKWTRLAASGNPTVLLMAYIPEKELVSNSQIGVEIQDNPELFLSKDAGRRFSGYMLAQREQMLGLRSKHTNRPELIEQYGYDTKFAYHMVRLGLQGVELLTTGFITLPVPEPDRSWLLDVRKGKFTKEEVLERSSELQSQLDKLIKTADLPNHANFDHLDSWLVEKYEEHWYAS